MKTYYDFKGIFTNDVTRYAERLGIYEIYSRRGNTITYYSYFGSEGFYKIVRNLSTGIETRKHLTTKPKNIGNKYNYFCG